MLCCRPTKIDTSNVLSVVELLVQIDCDACEKRVRRAISKIDGVDSVDVDMELQKVRVTGYVDQMEVLEVVRRRTRRKAEFWGYYNSYYDDNTEQSSTTFNDVHGYLGFSSSVSEDAVFVFSDDNPHAYCIIM